MSREVEELLSRWLEHTLQHGREADVEALCGDRPELVAELTDAIARYRSLDALLIQPTGTVSVDGDTTTPLPVFDGFRTIEKLGAGGGGEVYKVQDLELGRVVAIKLLRPDGGLRTTAAGFLREARSLALFDDPRIVRLYDLKTDADRPMLITEFVDGFELSEIGPSLEYGQRARIMEEVAEAVHGAHLKGLQHRDLKPANILVDRELKPRLLDFGLSTGESGSGHGLGTPAYMSPEQLTPGSTIDGRSDVFALGVILYELLCGQRPFAGETAEALRAAIRQGPDRLPSEIDSGVPEPLQAIALKAMESSPDDRYATAGELAADLRRSAEGLPVTARPSHYGRALDRKVRSHVEQVREWLRLRLIHPHEADRLRGAYQQLEGRDDDWIVLGRHLSWSQIALYLGAFLLLCGSVFFFAGYMLDAFSGLLRPLLTLGVPVAGLSAAGFALHARDQRAVAVAFLLAGTILLPFTLIILLREAGWLSAADVQPLFTDGWISNRQLQAAFFVATGWALWLALRTATSALAAAWVTLAACLHLSLLADVGLRSWFEEGQWDRLALGLLPLIAVFALAGHTGERRLGRWFATPSYLACAGLYVLALELLALKGRAFSFLGLSTTGFQPAQVSDPLLLDTVAAMTLNGLLIYTAGWLMERRGSAVLRVPAQMLYLISPFAILEPMLVLNATGEYSQRYCWLLLTLAIGITLASHFRQRKSFYFAGVLNTGVALWQITDRNEWFDDPWWASTVILLGLGVLGIGWRLDSHERSRIPSTRDREGPSERKTES